MKSLHNPTPDQIIEAFVDVTGADHVEVAADMPRGVLWININGVCLLRICQIKELETRDAGKP